MNCLSRLAFSFFLALGSARALHAQATTNPTASAVASSLSVALGQTVVFTVTVVPGANPASSGLAVTADLSSLGGSATQAMTAGANNTFSFSETVAATTAGGPYSVTFSASDSQSRTATTSLVLAVRGNLTIFHSNDTHARVTPDMWVVPAHSGNPITQFQQTGGAAYMAGQMIALATGQPDALVLDGGDISEGNPVGDWNGPGSAPGTFGNGTSVGFYQILDTKLRAVSGRGGRGVDAMVVGNHDIRDVSYINNLKNQTNFPVISINICQKGTQTPYFQPYVIVNVNGNKVGIIGYTTETSSSTESAVNSLIDVVKCDWSSTDTTKIHFANYVNTLRNTMGCNIVVLLTHDGHSDLCTSNSGSTPILVDNSVATLPEIAITGHWHTYSDTPWQPTALNYKTLFTEESSFNHYVGELRVNGLGKYISNANYPLIDAQITPDTDVANYIQTRKAQYAAANPTYGADQVIGYTAVDLLLDNKFKWWSSDEYPWSGNNTAGNWICDGLLWRAVQAFGTCDLSIESGGGVRSDIPAGPMTYTQIYQTYPWADDTLYEVKMTGQQIWNYFQGHGCDVALSSNWFVTAFDGIPTSITYNGQPINLAQTYEVAISNYMYANDSVPFTDTSPQTTTILNRDALVQFSAQFGQANPYNPGPSRYSLNTEFAGGFRAVVTMMNDADSATEFDDAFIRLLTATPETLQHLGYQVPSTLVNPDGTVNASNRLSEIEGYRSYLGYRSGVLHPGDIIETWGKGSFYQGDPEFVDQEGITTDGVEFKVVGHDASLAKPSYMTSVGAFFNNTTKNHFIEFVAKKTGTSTVIDQNGQTLSVMDVTAYSAKTLPGSVGDILLLAGIPTMENYALRFRCSSAVEASTIGVTALPTASTVSSHVTPLNTSSTISSVNLSATATANVNNTFTLAPIADAEVASTHATTNYGTNTNLYVQSATTGFGNERSWVKFSLAGLPAGAVIASAQLQLYCWSAGPLALPTEVDSGTNDGWTESGLTWNNQPTPGSPISTQTLSAGTKNLWYSWDVTSAAVAAQSGDNLVSLVAKPQTENAATADGFGFDSKEYGGSTAPILVVTTQAGSTSPTVAHVQYFFRYSSDNASWSSWNPAATVSSAPYATNFSFSQGFGYYEFYSQATDSNGGIEPAAPAAEAAVTYASASPYTTAAVVSLGNLTQTYDGSPKMPSVTTVPPGISFAITYNGTATAPSAPGSYAVAATVTQAGYTGSASGTLTILQSQTITFGPLASVAVGAPPITLSATSSSGLAVSYASSDTSVATISGNTLTVIGAGTTNITASQLGNGTYAAAPSVSQALSVSNSGGTGGNQTPTDTPALPAWALFSLAAVISLFGAGILTRGAARKR